MNVKATYTISNADFSISIDPKDGLIKRFFTNLGNDNFADKKIGFGGVRYTLKNDDIKTEEPFILYKDKLAVYESVKISENSACCVNSELGIMTTFTLEKDGLMIESNASNDELSQFGIDLNLNFLGKKNGTYLGQLLPSSPYTSYTGKRMYEIMSVIGQGFCAVLPMTEYTMWKIDYSSYCAGHYINGFQVMSSMDKTFGEEREKKISLKLIFAETIEECYQKIQEFYKLPMALPSVTGTFNEKLCVDVLGEADAVRVLLDGKEETVPVKNGKAEITSLGYGRHRIIPCISGVEGLDTQIWFGKDVKELFRKSCASIRKPYHGDDNLCEGMVWCWSLLCYMNQYGDTRYLSQVKDALKTVMCEDTELVERQSILPYATDTFPAYHIYKSKRVQEQFFGISILTEMYKLTKEEKYIDYAVSAAKTMIDQYQSEDGAIVPETDYTTVCAPMIPIVDLALIFREKDSELYGYFTSSAKKIADFLVKRDLHFPTEGEVSEINDEEMEEGSISCTALSVLYYCRYIEYKKEYIDFAEKVLKLHDYFVTYTPDAKLYHSTMRWWENIWEGDGTGPAICAGHAWTIWRAEADYHFGVLTGNDEYLKKSFNGFITNFSKIDPEGRSFACYQPDYFAGGGFEEVRTSLKQLSEEDLPKKYELTHDYPKHFDNSLSRYVWVRACATWLKDGRL